MTKLKLASTLPYYKSVKCLVKTIIISVPLGT